MNCYPLPEEDSSRLMYLICAAATGELTAEEQEELNSSLDAAEACRLTYSLLIREYINKHNEGHSDAA